jgi:uncharacterized protein
LKRIYLILGRECNCSCTYCHQENNRIELCTPSINPPNASEVLSYFNNFEYDPDEDCRLILFGGEPLIYWNFLKEFLPIFKEKFPTFFVSVVTNGTLLTNEIVGFFNKYGIGVSLSHDGPYHASTRRYPDLLQTNPDLFFAIEEKSVLAVCSSMSPDVYKIWDYFDEFSASNKIQPIRVIIQMIKDVGYSTDSALFFITAEQRQAFEKMLDKVFERLYLQLKQKKFEGHEWNNYLGWIYKLNSIVSGTLPVGLLCGENFLSVDMDLQGRLYNCHNSGTPFGNVQDLGLIARKIEFIPKPKCPACEYYCLCGGLCSEAGEEQFEHMCYIFKEQAKRLFAVLSKLKEEGLYA